eukprot:5887678-Amphidinium_carterae.1
MAERPLAAFREALEAIPREVHHCLYLGHKEPAGNIWLSMRGPTLWTTPYCLGLLAGPLHLCFPQLLLGRLRSKLRIQ